LRIANEVSNPKGKTSIAHLHLLHVGLGRWNNEWLDSTYTEFQGVYPIKVKAKNEHGAESVWSDPLSVSMPLCHPIMNLLEKIFHFWQIFEKLKNPLIK